ncbi:phosphopantetheine-binding protein [Bradyrhizobium sp. NC92]|uniref:phosphopantetheine-binding protein n=1 Tax=Bradyrhizobium sp. (strain NC92) TaxID=55395 RepID=UPI0039057702
MVPSAFVRLAALPLTVNGKLDRKALAAPDDEAYARAAYEEPQGEIETTLAQIWAELLGVERVGRHDHFFALGGHSLLAVQLLSRVWQAIAFTLPLTTLFAKPVLADLAANIMDELSRSGAQDLPAIAPVSRDAPLVLSFAQQRLWFLAQLDQSSTNITFRLGGGSRVGSTAAPGSVAWTVCWRAMRRCARGRWPLRAGAERDHMARSAASVDRGILVRDRPGTLWGGPRGCGDPCPPGSIGETGAAR